MDVAGIMTCTTQPTDAQARQMLDVFRSFNRPRGIFRIGCSAGISSSVLNIGTYGSGGPRTVVPVRPKREQSRSI